MITIRLKNPLSVENASPLLYACPVVLNGRFGRFLPRKTRENVDWRPVFGFSTGIHGGAEEGGWPRGWGGGSEPALGQLRPGIWLRSHIRASEYGIPGVGYGIPLPRYRSRGALASRSRGSTPVSTLEPVMAEPYIYPPRARAGKPRFYAGFGHKPLEPRPYSGLE